MLIATASCWSEPDSLHTENGSDIGRQAIALFDEQIVVPLRGASQVIDRGALVSVRLASPDEELEITSVRPVTENGLVAEFFGLSDCSLGCIGGGKATSQTIKRARRSVTASLPAVVTPDLSTWTTAVMRLRPARDGVDAEGCLRLMALDLELSDGRELRTTFVDGDWIAAIRLSGGPGTC